MQNNRIIMGCLLIVVAIVAQACGGDACDNAASLGCDPYQGVDGEFACNVQIDSSGPSDGQLVCATDAATCNEWDSCFTD